MLKVDDTITVTKFKFGKTSPFSYPGKVVQLTPEGVTIEAYFNVEDKPFHGVVFRKGDRFIETYFTARWYNIFEIHDRDTGLLKCWYCNVAQPAVFEDGTIWFIDMELDLLVYPDLASLVLDEDEFEALALPEALAKPARMALEELKTMQFKQWSR